MESRTVIPSGLYQHKEIANSFRSCLRIHPNSDISKAGVQEHIFLHLLYGRIFEGLDSLWLYLDADDRNGFQGQLLVIGGSRRNLFHDLDSLGYPAEGRELAVELRLRRHAYEELSSAAI